MFTLILTFVLKIVLNAILIAFIFGVVIFVHELGHFLLAKKTGVKVERFSLGFGRKLIGFKRGETEYIVCAFPIGGYVKMAGDEPGGVKGKPWEFLSKSPWQRLGIVVAGPVMNLVLASFLMMAAPLIGFREANYPSEIGWVEEGSPAEMAGVKPGDRVVAIDGEEINDWYGMNVALGELHQTEQATVKVTILRDKEKIVLDGLPLDQGLGITPFISTEIGSVMVGPPAYWAGLKGGDKIIAIDGKKVNKWQEMTEIIHASPDKELKLTIERNQEVLLFRVKPISQEILGLGPRGIIGIKPQAPMFHLIRFGLWESIQSGLTSSLYQVGFAYKALWHLLSHPGRFREYVGGPILIAQMVVHQVREGAGHFLGFVAVVNIWLMVVNLLPIPVLDGGHIIFYVIEGIRRKPLKQKLQQALQQVGLAVIIAIMVFALINDTLREVERRRAKGRASSQESIPFP